MHMYIGFQDKNNLVDDVRPKAGENVSQPGAMRSDGAENKMPRGEDQLNNTSDAVQATGEMLKQGVVRTMEVGLNIGDMAADVAKGTIRNVRNAMLNDENPIKQHHIKQDHMESYSNNNTNGNASFRNTPISDDHKDIGGQGLKESVGEEGTRIVP